MKARVLSSILCLAGVAWPLEIRLADPVPPKGFVVRYVLYEPAVARFVEAVEGVSTVTVPTTVDGREASRIRAVLFAPRCRLEVLDLPLAGRAVPVQTFQCRPVSSVELRGVVTRTERFANRNVEIGVQYVVRWLDQFPGLGEGPVTGFPFGQPVRLSADGHFRIQVPDFGGEAGAFQARARDAETGALVAVLIPEKSMRVGLGRLQARESYPAEISFSPCLENAAAPKDQTGIFTLRPGIRDGCDAF